MRATMLWVFLLGWAAASLAAEIEGQWVTVDDKTGEAKSIVRLWVTEAGELEGRIERILREDARADLCEECPGELQGQPIEGLRFLWGFTPDGDRRWHKGEILDPKNGKIYRATATLSEDGQSLDLRGYVGIPLFGRSQTWQRYTGETEPVSP